MVNTAKVKEPVKGYKDVFSGKYKKRIVVLNDAREIVSWALNSLGLPINDITPENLEKVKPVLAEWLPQVKVYDSDSPKTALLNGDVDLGIVWSGEAAILYKKNKKFQYVLPEEGAHQFIDSLAIPKGAPNKENAEKFINYILKPEVSVLDLRRLSLHQSQRSKPRKLLKQERTRESRQLSARRSQARNLQGHRQGRDGHRQARDRSEGQEEEVGADAPDLHGQAATRRSRIPAASQRRPGLLGWLLMAPMLLWLVAFVVAPTVILLVYSFCQRDELGQIVYSLLLGELPPHLLRLGHRGIRHDLLHGLRPLGRLRRR